MVPQRNMAEKSAGVPYNTFDYDNRPNFDVDYIFESIGQEDNLPILRVAAYIRVSTDQLDQENSYITQERYFHELITGNKQWEYAGVYSDYGISGTGTADRIGFTRLIRHCKEGKIDRVICKSISRFARNTADFSRTLLLLRELHVTIFFEKENLDSAEMQNEFILSVLGAYAQEESRSISSNIRLGQTMHMQQGNVPNIAIYGYRFTGNWLYTEDGYRYREIEINEKEADIVRWIYEKVADSCKFTEIARELNARGVPAPVSSYKKARMNQARKGQLHSNLDDGWNGESVAQIVRSERYIGDVIAQKTFTPDYLTHKVKVNKGEMPQYYIKDHHLAIVSRKLYKQAQAALDAKKKTYGERVRRPQSQFSKRLLCGECGRFFVMAKKTQPGIWNCPTAASNTALQVCSAESISAQMIVFVLHEAIYKEYGLTHFDVYRSRKPKTDKQRCKEDDIRKKLYRLFQNMLHRLERTLNDDYVERTRSIYKGQLAKIENELETETFEMERMERCISNTYTEKITELTESREKIRQKKAEYETLTEKLNDLERYWRELEEDYELRAEALQWLKGLPRGKNGCKELLNGITGKYFKAFILDITIHMQKKCTIRWFDNTCTNIVLTNRTEEG